jgi:nucleotide-binding universal stress UspA family protein
MKILIAVRFEKELLKNLNELSNLVKLEGSEIHLTHIFKKEVLSVDLTTYEWPSENEYKVMKKKGLKNLEKIGQDLFKKFNPKKIVTSVSLDFSAKEALTEKIKKEKYDVVIVTTRGLHGFKGLFHSSVADYLIKHSPTPILVLR